MILEQGGRGGVTDYTASLAAGLADRGWKVQIATASDHLYPPYPGVEALPIFHYVRAGSPHARRAAAREARRRDQRPALPGGHTEGGQGGQAGGDRPLAGLGARSAGRVDAGRAATRRRHRGADRAQHLRARLDVVRPLALVDGGDHEAHDRPHRLGRGQPLGVGEGQGGGDPSRRVRRAGAHRWQRGPCRGARRARPARGRPHDDDVRPAPPRQGAARPARGGPAGAGAVGADRRPGHRRPVGHGRASRVA